MINSDRGHRYRLPCTTIPTGLLCAGQILLVLELWQRNAPCPMLSIFPANVARGREADGVTIPTHSTMRFLAQMFYS